MKIIPALLLGSSLIVGLQTESSHAHGTDSELVHRATQKIADQPGNYLAVLERARLNLVSGDTAGALADIEMAKNIADRFEVAFLFGLYQFEKSEYSAAIVAFNDYLSRYPNHIPSIHNRAKAHDKLGSARRSIRDYNILLEVSKRHSPDYYLELARIESGIEPGGFALAIKTLDRGMDKLGLLVSLQNAAIQYEIEREDYANAIVRHQSLEPWLGKTVAWPMRQQLLVNMLAQTGNHDEAPVTIQF